MLRNDRKRSSSRQNDLFLIALGAHCRRLRIQRGLSIDRLSKSVDSLSTSVIHRLENGSGAVTVNALYRYALALEIEPLELFQFEMQKHATSLKMFELNDPKAKKNAYQTLFPLYSVKAAAGAFSAGREAHPQAWIELTPPKGVLLKSLFVVEVQGNSMNPKIQDGDCILFQTLQEASVRQGKIVLAQYRGPADPDTGGSYTVKRYFSSKVASDADTEEWGTKEIRLEPYNPDYEAILIHPQQQHDFRIIGEFIQNLGPIQSALPRKN